MYPKFIIIFSFNGFVCRGLVAGFFLVRESGESVYLNFIFIIISFIGIIFSKGFVTVLYLLLSRRLLGSCVLCPGFVWFNRDVLMGSLFCSILVISRLDLGIRLLIRPVSGFICL